MLYIEINPMPLDRARAKEEELYSQGFRLNPSAKSESDLKFNEFMKWHEAFDPSDPSSVDQIGFLLFTERD